VTYRQFDVVVVPFPFTDKATSKRRPALVLSDARTFNHRVGQSILAMITSAKNSSWPLDVDISNLDVAGLSSSSIVRMKLFTLDHDLIVRKAGELCGTDQEAIKGALSKLFGERLPKPL
jgi:mRNA interferase MazF